MSLNENQFEVQLNEDQQLIANIFMYNGVLQLLDFLENIPADDNGCLVPCNKDEFLAVVDEWIKENYG